MGFLDDLINIPGKIVETGCEIITRTPELGLKIIEGVVKRTAKGAEKVIDAIDKAMPD